MQIATILRILGFLLVIMSLTFIPPLFVELLYQDGSIAPYLTAFAFSMGPGGLFFFLFRNHKQSLRTQEGFLIVVMFWLTACLVSALPFYFMIYPKLAFTNAFFEAVSGITTTGATILTHLDSLPHSVLYYRQQLQFLGGIGIIILAVAILPTLGIGGMQLFRTEITGPVKDDKLAPRVKHTAKAIWSVYGVITLVCALCYWTAGMSLFDAISHSFSTVSTGGFSTHDASLGFFPSPYIKVIAIVFMFLGAVNFGLHYLVFKRKNLKVYWQDPEFKTYIKLIFSVMVAIWVALVFFTLHDDTYPMTVLDTLFETVSLITTSGFSAIDFAVWPSFIPFLLLFCGIIGGCAGSTSGGLKTIRVLLLQKQGTREIRRLIHPHGQYVVKLGDKPIGNRVVEAIWGFFVVYCVVFSFLLLLLMLEQPDFLTIYTALIACISNTGRAMGEVTVDFASLSDYVKWVLSFTMIVGRLEIFTVLVLFAPAFWRR